MREISDFLYRNFEEVKSYGDGSDLRVDCPFCGSRTGSEDYKQHLYVSTVKETCHCFRCEYSSTWIGLVMDVTGVDYAHAIGEVYSVPSPANFRGLRDHLERSKEFHREFAELPKDFTALTGTYADIENRDVRRVAAAATIYLRKRGFKLTDYQKHRLGVAPSLGYRVIIPVEDGYWQARALMKMVEPKYINPNVESGHVLFNAHALEHYDEVVICEGAFSAMAVGDNAIAILGKKPTKEKLDRIRNSQVDHFIVTIEEGAAKAMMMLADALKGFGKQVTIWEYEHGDPADSTDFVEKPYNLKTKLQLLFDR